MKERSVATQAGFKDQPNTFLCETHQGTAESGQQEGRISGDRGFVMHLCFEAAANFMLEIISDSEI